MFAIHIVFIHMFGMFDTYTDMKAFLTRILLLNENFKRNSPFFKFWENQYLIFPILWPASVCSRFLNLIESWDCLMSLTIWIIVMKWKWSCSIRLCLNIRDFSDPQIWSYWWRMFQCGRKYWGQTGNSILMTGKKTWNFTSAVRIVSFRKILPSGHQTEEERCYGEPTGR